MQKFKDSTNIQPVGDSALVIQMGETIDLEINQIVHALASLLMYQPPAGIGEAVPAYTTVLIHYDPLQLSYSTVLKWINDCMQRLTITGSQRANLVEIPTVYGGEFGPDLPTVAQHTGFSEAEVISRHAAVEYPVYMMGFTPGFPYLGGMDPKLATPRLETPRKLVRAGSVGIAGGQTGIYSVNSPGGWQLIGFTLTVLFDPDQEQPFLINPGDRLRFIPVQKEEIGL